jgi:predicted nucleic acid-binding Zn ribbon protein
MPIYRFKCLNPYCKEDIFERFRNISNATLYQSCPTCAALSSRTYEGQNVALRKGKIQSSRNAKVLWEDIDNVHPSMNLNTKVKGKVIDKATLEIE